MSIANEVYYIYEGEACWAEKVIDEEPGLFDGDDEEFTCCLLYTSDAADE